MGDALMLQWTLSQTVDNFLKVGQDLIRAASADNIQPLTLLACSRFGATLAISPLTRSKIQLLLKSQTDHVVVKFLKAHAGYIKGDSVDILSQSMAGINMLALAAALIAVSTTFEAGSALEIMIVESATDKSLVPTAYHLKDLLEILEPRLNRAGFLGEVLSWQHWWAHNSAEMYAADLVGGRHMKRVVYPSPEGIHQIVASFRELSRIGEASSIVFTVGYCAPWLTAFIKWCLGLPPTIYDAGGKVILEQQGSNVTLMYSGDDKYSQRIQIQIFREFNTLNEVIYASLVDKDMEAPGYASGMIELPIFARYSIERQRFHDGLGRRALLQALPYALKQVCDLCICGGDRGGQLRVDSMQVQEFKPFPEDIKVSNVMSKYLSLQSPAHLKKLDEGILVTDLPLVKLWAEETRIERENDFAHRLSFIIADILALTLFDSSLDHLMLYYPKSNTISARAQSGWPSYVRDILLDGRPRACPTVAILSWVLQMVDHQVQANVKEQDWVASSFRGQVVFPEIFETHSLGSEGFLKMVCIPGVLFSGSRNIQRVSQVRCMPAQYTTSRNDFGSDVVTRCVNLFPTEKIQWRTSLQADFLYAGIGWTGVFTNTRPFDVLRAFSHACMLKSCSHRSDEEMSRNYASSSQLGCLSPGDNSVISERLAGKPVKIGVYPVIDNDGLRLLSFASTACSEKELDQLLEQLEVDYEWDRGICETVVNENACLTCLVKAARLWNCKYIVL